MATEIERKFLVVGDAWRSLAVGVPCRQGYLSTDQARTVRVRTAGARGTLDQMLARIQAGEQKEVALLIKADVLQKIWILRKLLHPMDELAAVEFLIDKMKDTKTNAEFFDSMKRG